MRRERLDTLVFRRGLAETREQARRLILAGRVTSGGHVVDKPGHRFVPDLPLELKEKQRFVSRGGEKLAAALEAFQPHLRGRICLDIGSSTGGFTDCLLAHGAQRVYAVDVGKGQLHWKLRQDPRVVTLENVNARYLRPDAFPESPDFASVDVAFISLTKILPATIRVLEPRCELITLIKPQFEAGREQVSRGGVVRDQSVRDSVVAGVR